MLINFENCEVNVSELKRGAVVLKYYDNMKKPELYHITHFYGGYYNSNVIKLVVEDAEDSHRFDSSELVWPNP